ncbi:hypothetical protein MPSEU_000631500 [Mayamaea pseudoterrestris]|nr:hypothetical protein MPSEU_000631500 [Mayamaea pseudoterrestris]
MLHPSASFTFLLASSCCCLMGLTSAFLPSRPSSTPLFIPSKRLQSIESSTSLYARGRPDRNKGPDVQEKDLPTMNEAITAPQLRVITPNPKGKDDALGVMTRAEALQKAQDMGNLDLILINPTSDPPVCKIVDYQKFRYSQEKKAKEQRKNSKTVEVKEIKMSYKIDVHDYDVRRKSALKFLRQGNRVKCTVMFRGREVQHDALGYELLDKLAVDLEETCLKEGRPKKEGRNLSLILGPRPEVLKAVNDNRKRDMALKRKSKEDTQQQKVVLADGTEAELDLSLSEEDAEDDYDDDFDDDDEDDDDESLESLLGSDDLTDALFG